MAIVGIDLGTTNSVVATSRAGRAEVVLTQDGPLLPSVVAYTADEVLVGTVAQRMATAAPSRCITSVKRLMGARYAEVEADLSTLAYAVEQGAEGRLEIVVPGRRLTPAQVSSEILGRLRESAAASGPAGAPVRAVITVPAYFDDNQRAETLLAARLADIEVLRLLNEPTAAALAFGVTQSHPTARRVAVYDLGGGTFDVSLLEIGAGVVQVVATGGDTRLGGDDFDALLAAELAGACPPLDASGTRRLLEAATQAKIALSNEAVTQVRLPFLADGAGGVFHLDATATRSELEALIAPLLDRTLVICRGALYDADWRPEDVNEVLLVGGSTRIPGVRAAVAAFFGRPPRGDVDPDTVVAAGAAMHASSLCGEEGNLLLDVVPLSLGVEIQGGLTDRVLERNTTLPAQATALFSTARDGQAEITVHVVQGEREFVADNRTLGRLRLLGIAPARAGVPRIEVTFQVDVSGVLHVSAQDGATGATAAVALGEHAGVDAATVDAMLADADRNRARDLAAREAHDTRRDATVRLRELESDLGVLAGALGAEDERAVSGAMQAYRQAIDGGTPADIRKAEKTLDACARGAFRKQRGAKR